MQATVSKTWDDLKLTKQFINALTELGFEAPMPIQEKVIPLALAGQKVIGIAQTGTGKTAAYLLPILFKLKFAQGLSPRALVVAPSKELVIQIAQQARTLAKFTDLKVVELYGGVGPKAQIEMLQGGADLIIATPGRFMEIYLKGELPTKLLKLLVIDEADRMLDLNFMPQLRKIFEVLPPKRQDMLFSATYPPKVEKMALEFIDFPMKVEITPQASVTKQVTQILYRTPNLKSKLGLLEFLLKDAEFSKAIVFCRTKETVINLAKYLERLEIGSIKTMHSNKDQNNRINSLKSFKEEEIRLLISTDVSSRGIDVQKVSHVINFDVPVRYEDYVHRIGRTGRAFEIGTAITFVTPPDEWHINKIEKLINEKITISRWPEEVEIESTPFAESQQMAREIDHQKRLDDPDYKGAFHERKR